MRNIKNEMTNIKIENGIKIPTPKNTKWMLILNKMKIGDSIRFKNEREAHLIMMAGYYHKIKMTIRNLPDKTFRVWRVN